MFIGGGGGKKEVADRIAKGVKNIRSLPYQPLDSIRYSLSAADLHVVSIGNDVVGIVHPCKVYGAMAVSRPILLLGPNPCHVSDLIAGNSLGWHVSHGNVDGACEVLKTAVNAPREELRAMGGRAGELVRTGLSRDFLCGAFCDVLERGLKARDRSSGLLSARSNDKPEGGRLMQQGALEAASNPSAAGSPGPRRSRSNVEVVILTFNEELNLPWAAQGVCEWADAVHVVDSGSSDGTRRIAESFGAKVVHRPWLGYAAQKNWALDNLPIQADWVFILDADEAITPELRDEVLAIAARPVQQVPHAGFYINRLTYFLGKPIRHCGYFPSYNLRLFKRGQASRLRRASGEVHEHMVVKGQTERLTHIMLHQDRRGLEHFIAKHNRYSTLEARELLREQAASPSEDLPNLERGIAVRRWLKRNVLPRLPFSWIWRFLYMAVFRLGFLDGTAGLRFCLLLTAYDIFISLKIAELRSIGADPGAAPRVASPGGLAVPEGQLTRAPVQVTPIAPALPPNRHRRHSLPELPRSHRLPAGHRWLSPGALRPTSWPLSCTPLICHRASGRRPAACRCRSWSR